MSRGSEEAWQVTFRNFKCFRLCCVFGRTRRVWKIGVDCGKSFKDWRGNKKGTPHKGLLYHIIKFGLYSSGTLRRD